MHRAVNTVGVAALGAALVCALPTAGVADPGLKFEGGPWIPALALVASSPDEKGVEPRSEADASSYAPLLAFAVEPEQLGESAAALQRRLSEADSAPVAIPVRVSIGPAPGEGEPVGEVGDVGEEWAPAVLVVARADEGAPAEPAPPTRPGQAVEQSEARPPDETDLWVPALGITSGFLTQGTQGTVDSVFSPSMQDVRPSAEGHTTLLNPWMSASLEVMTPSPGDLPGRPRFFLHGDAGTNFGFKRNVAKEGAPGPFIIPDTRPPITSDAVVQGQGSTTSAEPETLMLGAGAGIAFTVDAMGRRIRIKPSVEYLREELDITGVVQRATVVDPGTRGQPADQDIPPTYDFVSLQGSQRQTYHGLGAGLELETDGGRAGPLVLTLFVSGQAYRILGERTTRFAATGPPVQIYDPETQMTSPPQTPSASWSFTKDAWTYRAGVGMRFRWQPAE